MKTIPSVRQVICSNPHSVFRYFAWPSVERLHDGTLAAVCSGFRLGHVCPFGKVVICYSRDEGQTWTAPAPVMDTPMDDRDAGLTAFGSGRVMLTSFNHPFTFYRKENEMYGSPERRQLISAYLDYVEPTDAEAKYLGSTYRISEDGGYTFGPVRIAPVSAPHGAIRMPDGSLIYIGRASAPESCGSSFPPEASTLSVWKFDEQDAFIKLCDIENIGDEHGWMLSCEPHALALPDGRIILHIRVQRKEPYRVFTIYQCESFDGGHSFTRPHQILSDLGGSPPHLMQHSSGRIICSFGYREAPCGIRVSFSDDQGETWSEPYVLEDGCPCWDMGYPATVEREDGSLLTIYYEATYASGKPEESSIVQRIWRMPDL